MGEIGEDDSAKHKKLANAKVGREVSIHIDDDQVFRKSRNLVDSGSNSWNLVEADLANFHLSFSFLLPCA